MIHKIEAIVLFVHDLPGCTAFYRDMFKLPYQVAPGRIVREF